MSEDFALSQGNLNLGEKSEENEMLGKWEVIHLFSVLFMMTLSFLVIVCENVNSVDLVRD